jgi:hypothetical protein
MLECRVHATQPGCRPNGPPMSLEGLQLRTSHAARTAALSEKGKSQCKIQPIKPAIQISDADRRRRILTSDECTMSYTEWDGSTDKGESFRVDQYKRTAGRCLILSNV